MCVAILGFTAAEVAFGASLAVSAVSVGMGYRAQQQTAEATNEALEKNAEAASDAYFEGAADLKQQLAERGEIASTEMRNIELARRRAQATALASSESAGTSLDMLMLDFKREEAKERDLIAHQLDYDTQQANRQLEGLHSQAIRRQRTGQGAAGPSALAALATFGSQGLSSYNDYATKDPNTGNLTLGS